jgi:hypothetical protein
MTTDVVSVDPDVCNGIDAGQGQYERIVSRRDRHRSAIPPGAILHPTTVFFVILYIWMSDDPSRYQGFVHSSWHHRLDPLVGICG